MTKKILALAYTSKEYRSESMYTGTPSVYSDRADLTRKLPCMDTWVPRLEDAGHEVIFFDGSNSEVTFDELNKILHLTSSESYDYFSLQQENKPSLMLIRLQEAISWALQNREFDYILRVDDGTYVNAYVVDEFLKEIEGRDVVWSGAGGGGGILFSKKACLELIEYTNTEYSLEDMAIFNSPLFKGSCELFTTAMMCPTYTVGEKLFTMHYATGKRMYHADSIISSYYNDVPQRRKVVLNYPVPPTKPNKTNTVNCDSKENTPLWYTLDKDKYNWEYFGAYTRSSYQTINSGIPILPFGKGSIDLLFIFNLSTDADPGRYSMYLDHYIESLVEYGFIIAFFSKNMLEWADRLKYYLEVRDISYNRYDDVDVTEKVTTEYIQKEFGTLIMFEK
jgi:hypothetical protein